MSGLLTMVALQIGPGQAVRTYARTLDQLKLAIVTVMAVLALGFVMNESGETVTLGLWLAGAGGAFALLSPILGWIGTAVTGSDTSSNSLFGALQVTAGMQAHLSPTLLAAANSSGGVLGKMISPQNLAIAAGAVKLGGREGDIFRAGRRVERRVRGLHVPARLPAVDLGAVVDGALSRDGCPLRLHGGRRT